MTKKRKGQAEELEAPATNEEEMLRQEVESLKQQLAEMQAKSDEHLQGWQRALADFSNYKRRIERDQAQASQNAAGSVIKRYLDIIDDLDRALKNRPQEGDAANWANGVELIYRKFMSILVAEGVKTIGAEGQLFDPNLHEAIVMEDSTNYASGQIVGVVEQGYVLGDRVLRPARVRVAR